MNKFGIFIKKNAPTIFLVGGILAFGGAVATGIIGGIKASDKVKELKEAKPDATKKDIFKVTYKYAIAPLSFTVAGVSLLVLGNHAGHAREVAITSMYNGLQNTFDTYVKTTEEIAGEKVANKISEAVTEKKVEEIDKAVENRTIIVPTNNNGKNRIYEPITGRWTNANIEDIYNIVNNLNKEALDHFVTFSLNDWFEKLNLDHVLLGDDYGWDTSYKLLSIDIREMSPQGSNIFTINYETYPIKL